jgi:hypothetical protein
LPPPRQARCPAAGNMRSDQIIPSVVDCTLPIADVRTLRVAAFVPYVLGLTLFVVAVPLSYASGNERRAAQFLAGALALFVTARLIKRGSLIATVVLATSLIGLVMSVLVGLAHQTPAEDILVGLLGFVIAGGICWLVMRAVAASWRLRRVPWRHQRAGIRSAIAELPRDRRLVHALSRLATSLAVYGGGCVLAIIIGFATGISFFAGLALLPFGLLGGRLLQRARRTLALHVEVGSGQRPPGVLCFW